jgi:hypothetical protein
MSHEGGMTMSKRSKGGFRANEFPSAFPSLAIPSPMHFTTDRICSY